MKSGSKSARVTCALRATGRVTESEARQKWKSNGEGLNLEIEGMGEVCMMRG